MSNRLRDEAWLSRWQALERALRLACMQQWQRVALIASGETQVNAPMTEHMVF